MKWLLVLVLVIFLVGCEQVEEPQDNVTPEVEPEEEQNITVEEEVEEEIAEEETAEEEEDVDDDLKFSARERIYRVEEILYRNFDEVDRLDDEDAITSKTARLAKENLTQAEDVIRDANQAYNDGEYQKAIDLANQAGNQATQTLRLINTY